MANLRYLKNRNRWWVRWHATDRISGYVLKGSRTFLEKSQALEFYLEMEKQEKLVRSGAIAVGETITEAVQKFKQHALQFTSRTFEHYEMVLDRFIESLPQNYKRITEIDTACIREYIFRCRDKNLKSNTINRHLTVIKSFCRYISETLNIGNPAKLVKMLPETPPEARFLKDEEYPKILETANSLFKPRIIFLANTGLRASEFASLKNDNLIGANSMVVIGKGRKRRTIPLNKSAKEAIKELTICSRRASYHMCETTAKKIGIPVFGPHSLRHYFATQMLIKGVNINFVSRILGHSSVRTTERIYAHILPEHLANATDVLDEI